MPDPSRTNTKLIDENTSLKQTIRELEKAESERKRIEAAYKDSELKYRSLIEHSCDVVFCVDQKGEYKFVNQVFASTFGKTPDYFLGKTFWDIYPKEHADHRQATSSKVFETGESQSVEVVVPLPERTLYFIAKANPVRDETGKVVLNLTHAIDITERKHAEEALQESETRYRLLAENATDVIWTVGMDMQLTYVSPSVTRLLGFTVEEAMARTAQEAYTPAAFEKAVQVFAEEMAIEGEGHHDPARSRMLELELFCKDGNTIPVEGHFRFIREPEGKAMGILAIMRDITDRKRMEDALRESEKKYRELSIVDDLTQLYNSRHFYHQLQMEIERSDRYGQPLTLMLLDLDDFKRYNDAYGHIEGDQVLLRLGQVVRRCLRHTDSAYRYGGEEFTILLPMTTEVEGTVTAERIMTEFKKEAFSPVSGRNIHVTVSIGLAQYKPQEEIKVFVRRVDQLMYKGKQNGKDRVCSESSFQTQDKA